MIKTLECPYCGQLNNVETDRFGEALCGACKRSFGSAALPPSSSIAEIASGSENASETPGKAAPDIGRWLSRIGGEAKQEEYVKQGFLQKIKKNAAKIPFAGEAVAMYYCAMDRQTPITAKLTAIGALAYIVLPVDIIPDFIAVLGFTDDAAAFWAAYKSISMHVKDEHREKAREWFEQ
ncbi:YkvA family protein [Paenibacillus sp. URB8-2]|uniref:YkvA family protein n=1 Tax=Paenibacillus sp. URB8-2 TaxID=2741301 RepID=UPI0015BA13D3|nr:YkvA family protein [Paenibacillus sp. URB8-2]BCG57375.1 hypothetical protein PUR_08000 [Paenibacillus sp. URB8-2]